MSLAQAIAEKWEASILSSQIPGGFYEDWAGANPTFPYQVFLVLGENHDSYSSTSTMRLGAFEIHTYFKNTADGTNPRRAIDALVDATEAAFDEQTLTISNRTTLTIRQNDRRTFEEDAQVYRGLNEFDILIAKARA